MAQVTPSPRSPAAAGSLPAVRLDVRAGGAVTSYTVGETGFLLGGVPGCDLRLPGSSIPPVVALVARHPAGVTLRKLAPIAGLLLNDQPVGAAPLADGDRITLGSVDITVAVSAVVPVHHVQLYEENGIAAQGQQFDEREQELLRQAAELEAVRREMTELRQQIVERYRDKRDRLAVQQEAVRRAARKLQERKREFDAELEQARAIRAVQGSSQAELTTLAEELTRRAALLANQQKLLDEREQQLVSDIERRERELEEEKKELQKSQAQHQSDLARLDRLADVLGQRQKQVQQTALEVDRRYEQMQRHTRELEEQAGQLDEWNERLRQQDEAQAKQKQELDAARAELAQRTAALEGQQAMLATLRSRLERMREEHRRDEQALAARRDRIDAAEAESQERLAEARQLADELRGERQLHDERQRQFDERRATLDAAVAQLRQAQEALAAEADEVQRRGADVEGIVLAHAEQAALFESRSQALEEQQQRLEADRQALAGREANLARAEQVIAALQEQLRRRSDELAGRQRNLDDEARRQADARGELDSARAADEERRRQAEHDLGQGSDALVTRAAELAERQAEVARIEAELKAGVDELHEGRTRLDADRAAAELARTELEALRGQVQELLGQLPEHEQSAAAALERVTQAREQLREHLAGVHDYARQAREDLEALRAAVRDEQEQLRQREQALLERQDEHRLSVAAFRQQMIDWQGQLAELKQGLAQGEWRLERRQAEVEEQAQQIATTSQRLAMEAEKLQEQQREVVQRRQEIDRHLDDMRQWYRKKLRELARGGEDIDPPAAGETPRDILVLTGEVDPGDRQLGELLRSLELVDADTLTVLLVEARRQRRSLRQLLLAGNYLTLFQMALIEAGNLDALVLGPVRVIDRLHATPREAAYRVFDPRRGQEVLLRHLAECELDDPVRPDEFRQRFGAAAAVQHPHLQATWEVLEINGRPAVLQEWLTGLPSSDWPSLAAAPGVCFRLLCQAALGLKTAHQAGLIHGNLHPGQVVFTAEGVLKLCGLGEPEWLALPPPETGPADMAGDLAALGRCAMGWVTPGPERRGPRTKPLPASLQTVLRRLCGDEGDPLPDAAELLDALDVAGADVPANPAAWERFVRAVREQSSRSPLRRSA